jgi:A/G-specific adenine glycosylase
MPSSIQSQRAADAKAKKLAHEIVHETGDGITEELPLFSSALVGWFREQGRDLPWRRTRDPYSILVSEIMLQQTQVATVIDYYLRWLARFPDAATLAAATVAEVLFAWEGLGYYSRARNLHAAAQRIVDEHRGVFPEALEAIRALPGVGLYTAAAVATFAFNQPTPPIDGNIARVIARLLDFWEPIDTASALAKLRQTAVRWQPESQAGLFNEALMELGALICTPRAPACLVCPVRVFCRVQEPELLPVKKPRPKTVRLIEHCGWVVRSGEVLLEQQTGKRWRGLWRLPLLTEPHAGVPLVSLSYPFTRHRSELSVFHGSGPLIMAENQRWFQMADLASTAMPAPHRRALKRLLKLLDTGGKKR